MRSVEDRTGGLESPFAEVVALCASRSPFESGYTPREHAAALDRLLADIEAFDEKDVRLSDEHHADLPELVVRAAEEETAARPRLALAC